MEPSVIFFGEQGRGGEGGGGVIQGQELQSLYSH